MNSTLTRRIAGAGFAAALLLGGAACGDDDDTTEQIVDTETETNTEEVDVTVEEPSAWTVIAPVEDRLRAA